MLAQPIFTKYFPNAVKSLIKPDETINYKPFIVSKYNPKTWDSLSKDPKRTSKGKSPRKNRKRAVKSQREEMNVLKRKMMI